MNEIPQIVMSVARRASRHMSIDDMARLAGVPSEGIHLVIEQSGDASPLVREVARSALTRRLARMLADGAVRAVYRG